MVYSHPSPFQTQMDNALYDEQRRNREDIIILWFMDYLKQKNPEIDEAFVRPCEYQCWSYENFTTHFPDAKDFFRAKLDVISEDPVTKELSVLREGDELRGNIFLVRFDN